MENMSFFAKLYNVGPDNSAGMMYLYVTIVILTIIVYNLGFAKKLPLLLNVVIYILLMLGCTVLTFFGVFLPMGEALVVAALFLGIYRFRLYRERKVNKEVAS